MKKPNRIARKGDTARTRAQAKQGASAPAKSIRQTPRKNVNRDVRLHLSLPTCRAINRVVLPLLDPETRPARVVHFVIDLALANMHLLRGHIAGAVAYADKNNLLLCEVLGKQIAMQTPFGAPAKKKGGK